MEPQDEPSDDEADPEESRAEIVGAGGGVDPEDYAIQLRAEADRALDWWDENNCSAARFAALDSLKCWKAGQQLERAAEVLLARAEADGVHPNMVSKLARNARQILKDASSLRYQAVEQAEKMEHLRVSDPATAEGATPAIVEDPVVAKVHQMTEAARAT